jgi:5'-nucleotidase
MQLSGIEVQELFDFVARRSAGRGCVSQVQIAGARVVIDCLKKAPDRDVPGVATNIYIGSYNPPIKCEGDVQCPGKGLGSCDPETSRCWQAIDPISIYELATSNYLAQGGSGFRVLQRNTTQLDTKVQQRDALIDYIRGGLACGADDEGELQTCAKDADCASVGEGYVCACPEATLEADAKNPTCRTDPERSCTGGQCVLAKCRDDVALFIGETCEAAPTPSIKKNCEAQIAACASAGEQCKFLPCVDRRLGNFSDGRIRMVGQ